MPHTYIYMLACTVIEDDSSPEILQNNCQAHTTAVEEQLPIIPSEVNKEEVPQGLSKKEKAQRKKDKKLQKDKDKLEEKARLKASLADLPSQRAEELQRLNQQLLAEGLGVKDVAADGHCLYRYGELYCAMRAYMNRTTVVSFH